LSPTILLLSLRIYASSCMYMDQTHEITLRNLKFEMLRSVWSHLDVANLSRCRLWKKTCLAICF